MGFLVKVDEDKGEVLVSLGDKIVSSFRGMENMKEGLEAQLQWSGGDYLKPHVERMLIDTKLLHAAEHAEAVTQTENSSQQHKFHEHGSTSNCAKVVPSVNGCCNKAEDKLGETQIQQDHDNTMTANITKEQLSTKTEDGIKEPDTPREDEIELPEPNENASKLKNKSSKSCKIWNIIEDHGPLKDAHVNVLWSAYFDDTLERFTEHFQLQRWIWENTPGGDHDMWVSRFEAMRNAKVPITNIVALGLGSLHDSNPGACCGYEPMFIEGKRTFISSGPSVQLAIVMKMREILGDNGNLLPCVIQDPIYSNLDKRFLRSLDFTVVDDPDAFEMINENSLVFAMGVYPRIMWWICDSVWPAAILTEKGYEDAANVFRDMMHGVPAYVAPGLSKMFQEYKVDRLFREKFFHQPGITKLYLRKEGEPQADTSK